MNDQIIKKLENIENLLTQLLNKQNGNWEVTKPNSNPYYSDNVRCSCCGLDSGIPTILGMVVPPEGLRCPHCGMVVVHSNLTFC